MLTPDEITALRANVGAKPVESSQPSSWDAIQAKLSAGSKVAEPPATPSNPDSADLYNQEISGATEKIGGAVKTAQDELSKSKNAMDIVPILGKEFLGVGAGAMKALYAPITVLSQKILEKTGLSTPADAIAGKLMGPLKPLIEAHPEAAKNISDALTIIGGIYGTKALNVDIPNLSDTIKRLGNDIATGGKTVKDAVDSFRASMEASKQAKATAKLAETINPKTNAKTAMSEGRLVRGKESTLFGKEPDQIIPSERTQQVAKTIQTHLGDTSKMSDAELHSAIGDRIIEIAKPLDSEMAKTPVFGDTLENATNKWKVLKSAQTDTPDFQDLPGNKTFQKNFQARLGNLSSDSNMKDVWDAAKDYDASIPQGVKQATSQSAPGLQYRKTMWLQNRAILRDILTKSSDGLKDTAKSAFEDMHDMYNAQQGLLSKAKVDIVGKAGILPKTKGGMLKLGAEAVVGGVTTDYILHRLGIL